jgi:hypothetical protein
MRSITAVRVKRFYYKKLYHCNVHYVMTFGHFIIFHITQIYMNYYPSKGLIRRINKVIITTKYIYKIAGSNVINNLANI